MAIRPDGRCRQTGGRTLYYGKVKRCKNHESQRAKASEEAETALGVGIVVLSGSILKQLRGEANEQLRVRDDAANGVLFRQKARAIIAGVVG